MKKMRKENKGITLVALVVTIIILLILAGVTIYFAVNGGLLGKVEEAENKTNQAGQNETNTLDQAASQINQYLAGNAEETLVTIEYEFNASSGTITGIKDKANYYHEDEKSYILPGGSIVVIPSQIDETEVKKIGNQTFESCTNITKVIIPDGVTSLEGSFKSCNNLETVIIPETVTSLGTFCFYGCSSLTNITIPESVTLLGYGCFDRCSSLTNITIPESVTSLEEFCFWGCSSLTSITIPKSVVAVKKSCFDGCSNLATVNYTGTQQEWNAITKGTGNDPLSNANIVYNYRK